jgi:Protein of unknown function (DUF3141)
MFHSNPFAAPFFYYFKDAFERSVLFLDVLRRRGNDYLEQSNRTAPHVLIFGFNLLSDGRTLPKPVNYALVEIVPPADVTIDPRKRPFIIFDPRAGHGPGIGGMKHDSEIGVSREFVRCRQAHATLDQISIVADNLDARSLFDTLDMSQKPDGLRILDQVKRELFVWKPGDHEV